MWFLLGNVGCEDCGTQSDFALLLATVTHAILLKKRQAGFLGKKGGCIQKLKARTCNRSGPLNETPTAAGDQHSCQWACH
jgi:hypothetical protein